MLEDNDIKNLCSVLQKPGDTIDNPRAGARGQQAVIRDPGTTVLLKAEQNMKLTAYYLRHAIRTSRPMVAEDITVPLIRSMKLLKEGESNHTKPEELPKVDKKDWVKTLEDIVEYLGKCLGSTGIPLAYVVRKDDQRVVKDSAEDPLRRYQTPELEMITRAPHYVVPVESPPVLTATFKVDNKMVMEVLHQIFMDHDAFAYIKRANRVKDGRDAYQS